MIRIAAALFVAAQLLFSQSAVLATREASTPSVKSLLAELASTQKKAKSVHGVGNSTFSGTEKQKGKTVTTRWFGSFVADASTTPTIQAQVAEPLTSTVNGSSTKATLDYVAIRQQVAEHVKGKPGWKCSSINVLNDIPVWTPGTFNVGKINTAKETVKVTGSSTVSGSAVWRLSVTKSIKQGKATTKNSDQLYLDKSTGSLRKWNWSQTSSSQTGRITLSSTVTFSHYGEHLGLTMPSCGSGSGGTA